MMRKTLREFYYVIGVGTVPAKTDSIIEMCAMQKSHVFRFIYFSCPKNLLFKKVLRGRLNRTRRREITTGTNGA